MKLSEYAKEMGVTYKTAYRWFKAGNIPHTTEQTATGTILVHYDNEVKSNPKVVLYGRVSSNDQKEDLNRQMERLRLFAASIGLVVSEEYSEIASGMNSNRKKLNKILLDPTITIIIVEHKDRLSRFGFNLLENALSANNRQVLVMNETEHEMDLVQDFIDVVTSMCSRIYGKRSAKNKIDKIKSIVK